MASEDLSGHHLLDRNDNLGLDLLHRDIERLLGRTDEPHDDRFEIVSGAECSVGPTNPWIAPPAKSAMRVVEQTRSEEARPSRFDGYDFDGVGCV
ncbi:MAG: hypothetical protein ACREXY_25050 [Gammaproteobacteria bacterium]